MFAVPGDVIVGTLIGSPSMAFFEASIGMAVADGGGPETAARPAAGDGATRRRVVARGLAGGRGSLCGAAGVTRPVYATDYRGLDRAIQVQAGRFFRKVVVLDAAFRQGDLLVPNTAGAIFMFDADTGARISHRRRRTRNESDRLS